MKIELLVDLPISKKHGATKGRVFEALDIERGGRGSNGVWFMGDAGEKCKVLIHEFKEVESTQST